jgi:hypothetical protein
MTDAQIENAMREMAERNLAVEDAAKTHLVPWSRVLLWRRRWIRLAQQHSDPAAVLKRMHFDIGQGHWFLPCNVANTRCSNYGCKACPMQRTETQVCGSGEDNYKKYAAVLRQLGEALQIVHNDPARWGTQKSHDRRAD